MTDIHPSVIIDSSVTIEDNVTIQPYSIIGPNVLIKTGCHIGPNVHIVRNVTLEPNVKIHFGACLGDDPQDYKYQGEESGVIIGEGSQIREYVTIHRATKENSFTTIGKNCMLMVASHVGHDSQLGNHVYLTNYVGLSGFSILEDGVNMGAYSGTHQFCRVGQYAMIGAKSKLTQDVLPFMLVEGNPARVCGINIVGLKRNGFSDEEIEVTKAFYHDVYRKNKTMGQSISELEDKYRTQNRSILGLKKFFPIKSSRGILLKAKKGEENG